MSAQDKIIKAFDGRVFGIKVSDYGLKCGYLDYGTLAKMIGNRILNNTLRSATQHFDWELIAGRDQFGLDEDGRECDLYSDECVDTVYYEIYQHYVISEEGYRLLERYTDEIVYYNSELDTYLWCVTHFGTSWDYVLTDIMIVNC